MGTKYDFTIPFSRAVPGHCNGLFDTASDKNLTASYPLETLCHESPACAVRMETQHGTAQPTHM